MSTENGPSIDSAASSAASGHDCRAAFMPGVLVLSGTEAGGSVPWLHAAGAGGLPASARVHGGAVERGRETGDEIVDVAAQEHVAAQREARRARREQVRGVQPLEARVADRVVGHRRDDAHAHAQLDVGLDHVGIERRQHDVRHDAFGVERRVDLRPAGEGEVVGDDRMAGERGQRQRNDLGQRMAARHQHAAVPLVAGKRHQLGKRRQRLGRNADVDLAAQRLLGDLQRIALVQDHLDLRVPGREVADDRRQHVACLRVRGRDREHPGVLALEFGADAPQVLDLAQRPARGGDHRRTRRRERRQPLAVADEHRHAELVLELPHLFADPRLRREQRQRRRRRR